MEMEAILAADARGIAVFDEERNFRFVSTRFSELFGFEREELIGFPAQILGREFARASMCSSIAESREVMLTRRDGTTLSARVTCLPFLPGEGRGGFLLFVQDLTQEKHMEDVLRKTERLASAGRMAAAVAHEINNPLEAVMNLLYLLRNQTGSPEAHGLLSLAESELERVSRIARQTLAFYRESGEAGRVDIRELLNLAVSVHSMRTSELRVHRRYRTNATISGYASELQQVFHNLVGNAIEAGATDIYLHISRTVETRPPHRPGVRISVSDNGSGIDPMLRGQIFNPFFTTKGERGTGLGLWTSRGIIVRHEGTIRVRSSTAEGRSGTCFRIFLPS